MNSMSHDEYVTKIKSQIVETASKMIDGKIDLIEGCRQIVYLGSELDEPDDDVFLTFAGVESETDDLPIGRLRGELSPEALARKDTEKIDYLAKIKGNVLNACRLIIAKYAQ